jgi:anion-transporting  ArsA/GET3 family ATPase
MNLPKTSLSKKIATTLHRNLIFIHGKGGVGKTSISQAIALGLAEQGKKTLWVTIEDPTRPPGELLAQGPCLWHLNCSFKLAFEEYVGLKIGLPRLTQIFIQNKLMQYLAKAAPGVHEIVLLGKIWYERSHYDHVIVDMPSTGYGLAMFQSTENISNLFGAGPLHRDAEAMLKTLRSPEETGHVVVSLPEEMPLRESLELNDFLVRNFKQNPATFLVNRVFPTVTDPTGSQFEEPLEMPRELSDRVNPLATSIEDYARMRTWLESFNLRIWKEAGISFGITRQIPPDFNQRESNLVRLLCEQLTSEAYL